MNPDQLAARIEKRRPCAQARDCPAKDFAEDDGHDRETGATGILIERNPSRRSSILEISEKIAVKRRIR